MRKILTYIALFLSAYTATQWDVLIAIYFILVAIFIQIYDKGKDV